MNTAKMIQAANEHGFWAYATSEGVVIIIDDQFGIIHEFKATTMSEIYAILGY
jgi:hypothetical protein